MSILKWGSAGDEVAKLQETLRHLGYYAGAIDGRFGPLTRSAVMAFQQAAQLVVDGIVGPATWAALAEEPAPSSGIGSAGEPTTDGGHPGGKPAAAQAMSLHIGVNRVDPATYGGWNGALGGCENDARTMMRIASTDGFTTRQLFTTEATTANVLNAIRDAARQLTAGGLFLCTYAGHGGQVTDVSGDDETDQQDETWVLYDRQLLDDEVEQALSEFAPGVGIVMLSDSCHSGTVYRRMLDPIQRSVAELKQAFYTDLAVPRSVPTDEEASVLSFPRPVSAARQVEDRLTRRDRSSSSRGGPVVSSPQLRFPGQRTRGAIAVLERPVDLAEEEFDTAGTIRTREMPFDINLMANQLQAEELRDAKSRAPAARGAVRASGLLISGCMDSQLSQEVGGHGVFTTTLERTWANSTFTGSYESFHRAIRSQMGPTQIPELSLFGADAATLAERTPFDG